MGFDGLSRPQQALGFTDMLGHLHAAEQAKESARNTHEVSQHRQVDAIGKDPKQKHDGERKQDPPAKDNVFEEELRVLIQKHFKIDFQNGVVYRFVYREEDDRIILRNTSTDEILLTLAPEEFIQLTEQIKQASGVMTDRVG